MAASSSAAGFAHRGGRALAAYARHFAWGGLAGLVFTDTVASLVRVEGVSMQPLLNPASSSGGDQRPQSAGRSSSRLSSQPTRIAAANSRPRRVAGLNGPA